MTLAEILPNLKTIIEGDLGQGVAVIIDDGNKVSEMEDALKDVGAVIVLLQPQGIAITDAARGAVKVDYSTTVWIRTNPKAGNPPWNPFTFEAGIILAVLRWSKPRVHDQGFHLTPDMEPETDFTDVGNNSRLVRFTTRVQFA
jgi:hypothetical protein